MFAKEKDSVPVACCVVLTARMSLSLKILNNGIATTERLEGL